MLQASSSDLRDGDRWYRSSLGARCLGLAVILFSSALGHAQIALDGSMGPAGSIAGPNHAIGSELGQIKGNNLFYSFSQFNIPAGESATFTGPSTTANIISRVTGGLPSSIDGTIESRTSMPSANLFLLNPSGVMIGPNARLNVGGSFHVSTADYVRFADGTQYFANLARQSTLTVAEPVAFGFLNPVSAGSISMDGSNLSVNRGKTLSFVGRDVQIVGAVLSAPGGRIHLNSQGTGEVSLQSPAPPSNAASGTIDITGSTSDVSGGSAGTVVVRGGRLLIDTSSVTANTSGSAGGAPAEIGSAGPMQILAPALNMTGNASIQSLNSSGQAGDIVVHVGRLSMSGGAQIQLDGGKLEVTATESVAISDRAGISSETLGRNAGSITLVTPALLIDNGFISTATTGTGNASSVSLEVGTLSLINGGQIVSSTNYDAAGAGGHINIAATGSIAISGSSPTGESPLPEPFKSLIGDGSSGIFSTAFSVNDSAGVGGTITIGAPTLTLSDGGKLFVATIGPGAGGSVALNVGTLTIENGASITTIAEGTGNGGKLDVTATDAIVISDEASISSQALVRDVGPISVHTPKLVIDNGFISTATADSGSASSVSLTVGSLRLIHGGQIASSTINDAAGAGGSIDIAATGSVAISGRSPTGESPLPEPFKSLIANGSSGIFSTTGGPGNGGGINVTADRIDLELGGTIGSSTSAGGQGGNISLTANQVDIVNATLSTDVFSGKGAGGDVLVEAVNIAMSNGSIVTHQWTDSNSPGGAVTVRGSTLTMDRSASIQSQTDLGGKGGDVIVEVENLTIMGGASVSTNTDGAGATGSLTVTARGAAFIADPGSLISSTSSSEGPVGDLVIRVDALTLTRGAQIEAGSFAGTGGGKLNVIATKSIEISDGAGMFSQASTEDVGPITVFTPLLIIDNGYISTTTLAVNAGGVSLDVGSLGLINGGQIAGSSIINAIGAGGNIEITARGPVTISGRSPTGVSPIPEPFTLTSGDAGIFSTASSLNPNAGAGGKIAIAAPNLALSNGGKLSVATIGPGAAGSIALDVGSLTVQSGASITSSTSNSGNAGGIAVLANTVTLANGGRIDSGTTSAGRGGTITLVAGNSLSLAAGSGLFSNADGTGPGGDINVTARQLELTGGSTISASSTGSAEALAGNVNIVFGDTLHMDGSSIATRSQLADGGNITITSTGSMLTLNNSQITTSVQSGLGSGGNITLGSHSHPLSFAVLNNSGILANAFGGDGGNIDIFADVYLLSGTLVDASSAQREPGTINVEARFTNLSDSLVQLPDNVLQAATLLRAACTSRVVEGKASSLVVAGREGVPPEPEGLLWSPLDATLADLSVVQSEGLKTGLFPRFAGLWFGSNCAR